MRTRNVRRREAARYLERERRAGRTGMGYVYPWAAECRAAGHCRCWHVRFPRRFYGEPTVYLPPPMPPEEFPTYAERVKARLAARDA